MTMDTKIGAGVLSANLLLTLSLSHAPGLGELYASFTSCFDFAYALILLILMVLLECL